MSNLRDSIVRTVVPMIVGPVVLWLVSLAPDLDTTGLTEALSTVVAAAISAVYYVAVRLAERRFPNAGALLGRRSQPVYVDTPAVPAA